MQTKIETNMNRSSIQFTQSLKVPFKVVYRDINPLKLIVIELHVLHEIKVKKCLLIKDTILQLKKVVKRTC